MTTIRIGFQAGHVFGDAEVIAEWLRHVMDEHKLAILLTSEAQQPNVLATVRQAMGPDYLVMKQGEYLCTIRRATVHQHPTLRNRVLRLTNILGLIQWRQTRAGIFWLTIPGKTLCMHAIHFPAGVEYGDNYRTDRATAGQVRASRRAFRALGRRMRMLAARRPHVVPIVAADSNLDQHRPAWRGRIETWTTLETCWTHQRPTAGTHDGGRLIDIIAARRGVQPGVIAAQGQPADLDHKFIWAEVEV